MSDNIAIVRVRAQVRMSGMNEETLHLLNVPVPNSCAVIKNTPEKMNMVTRVAGVLTWGELSDESLALLRKKAKDPKATHFRLNPPRKGYSKKGSKLPFVVGGALGYRGDKINDLIQRMVD